MYYDTNSYFKAIQNSDEDKPGINYSSQLKILIMSEENAKLRENLREYCNKSKNHPDFDEKLIVDDIINSNFSFCRDCHISKYNFLNMI